MPLTSLLRSLKKHPVLALTDVQAARMPTRDLEAMMDGLSRGALLRRFGHDAWLCNYVLSVWERMNHQTVLGTYPWHQSYTIADFCNAKCAFCEPYLVKSAFMDDRALGRIRQLLPYARTFILTGGEPTIHPRFREFLREIQRTIDPRCFFSIITNGARLHRYREELAQLNVSCAISLNAASAASHHRIMRLGEDAFPKILDSIRYLRSMQRFVSASFVVTADSLAEVPEFLELCASLDVNEVYIRTMNPFPTTDSRHLDYVKLHPSKHPAFAALHARARAAIDRYPGVLHADPGQWALQPAEGDTGGLPELSDFIASLRASTARQETGVHITATAGQPLPPGLHAQDAGFIDDGNPYGRQAPFHCDHVYYAIEVLNQNLDMWPCCFLNKVPGYELVGLTASDDFFALWNSPAFVRLRESLLEGPMFPSCKTCTYQLGY